LIDTAEINANRRRTAPVLASLSGVSAPGTDGGDWI